MLDFRFNLSKTDQKRKLSPNRKQYLSLWAYCDQNHFKITWTVSDRKENILKKGVLLTKESYFVDIWSQLKFYWMDDERFIVELSYKGLITDAWAVNIAYC